jgi:hypothetical protein
MVQMEGAQAKSDDPVTRVVTTIPGTRLRNIRLTVDSSGLGSALAGLELFDGARKNGIVLAVRGTTNKLCWRPMTSGRWGEWRDLPYQLAGTKAVLALDLSGGHVFAADPGDPDPSRRTQLSDVLAKARGEWSLSIFGTADPGVTWKAGFDDLVWRLKAENP